MVENPVVRALLGVVIPLGVTIDSVTAQSTIHTPTCVIRGRFVDAETSAPIPRCTVKLTGHQSTGYDLAWSVGDWVDPDPITTGRDGAFRFQIRLPVSEGVGYRSRYHLNTSHPDRAAWFSDCNFTVLEELGEVDYGDIALPTGVRPRVKVVDTNGKPQAGVSVRLRKQDRGKWVNVPEYGPRSWVSGSAYLLTDIDGYLHPRDALAKGVWGLEVEEREVHKAPGTFDLPSTEVITAVVKAVDANDVLEGRLVDTAGLPVGRALLAVGGRKRTWFYTRRDGRFTVLRPEGNAGEEAVIELAKNRRYDSWVEVGRLRWGERQAKLEVPAETKVTFQVVTGQGKPVEEFNLYCLPLQRNSPVTGVRRSGRFPDGRALCRLSPGAYRLLVYPRGKEAVPTDWREIEIGEREVTEQIELPSALEGLVQATLGDEPLCGARIELIHGTRPGLLADIFATPRIVDQKRVPSAILVAADRTDANGRALLHARQPDDDVFLRISGPGIQTAVHEVTSTWGRGETVVIQASAAATLHGVLGPIAAIDVLDVSTKEERTKARADGRSPASWRQRGSLPYLRSRHRPSIVVFVGTANERWADRCFPVDEQGRFEVEGLPPGTVRLGLVRFLRQGESRATQDPEEYPLGEFHVDPATPKRIEVSVPQELRR